MTSPADTALLKIAQAAADIKQKDPNVTEEQAIARACETRPDLASSYTRKRQASLPAGYFAFQDIEKAAKEVQKKNPGLTKEQAVAKVYGSRPDLVGKYHEEVRKHG